MPLEHIDQMGRTVVLEQPPKRIVSIVPSQTELLHYLGLDAEIAGITWFCIHPSNNFTAKQKIGGTKKLQLDRIDQIKPDLIIGNKEENDKGQILDLESRHKVWMSDIETLEDALMMIQLVGEVIGKEEAAHELCGKIIEGFSALSIQAQETEPLKAAYLIWRDPWMAASGGTFINDMMKYCGLQNVLEGYAPTYPDNESLRYPQINLEELVSLSPEVVLLSSEPFPFKEKHIQEIKRVLPYSEVILADGEMFSWYGSRLLHSPLYFSKLTESFRAPVLA